MPTQHTDIIIAGAGSAGVAAAIAAARQGLQVTLIEKNAFAGGNATAAEVGTICGLYHVQKNQPSQWLVKGFSRQFAQALQQVSGTEPHANSSGLHYLPYRISAFKNFCRHLLETLGVKQLYQTDIHAVSLADGHIQSIEIEKDGIKEALGLKAIIDCTGHSVISQLAGLPMIQSSHYQAAAQVFTMAGLSAGDISEQALALVIMKSLRKAILDKQLGTEYESLYLVPGSLDGHSVSLKMGLPLAVTHTEENKKQLLLCATQMLAHISRFLVKEIDIFSQAWLEHTAPQLGIRVGYRSVGKYLVNETDILGARKFEDAIANSSWPMEDWQPDKRVDMRFLPPGEYYQLPAACLQSDTVPNLFFAGRNISATDGAIASARVMGCCLQTGYAAGVLAAAAAGNSSMAAAIALIQKEQL